MDKYIGKGEGYEGISLASSVIPKLPIPIRKIVVKSVITGGVVTVMGLNEVLEALQKHEAN
jgi:hypothetical protein